MISKGAPPCAPARRNVGEALCHGRGGKTEFYEPDYQFFQDLSDYRNWQPFTGDHTRTAAALLKEAYPNNPKWQLFKFYLSAQDTKSDEMLRNLGNVNNTLAGLQKKLGFVDKSGSSTCTLSSTNS